MNKCIFCSTLHNRFIPNSSSIPAKYCSAKCIKRAWYLRNNPGVKSYFNHSKDFWKTETGIGFKWEKFGASLLGAKHLEFNNSGADLLWNDKFVDVKSCSLWRRKTSHGRPVRNFNKKNGVWVFNRNKNKPVDYFLCIGLVKNKPKKILLIPSGEFPRSGIVIGIKSKYDKFAFNQSQ